MKKVSAIFKCSISALGLFFMVPGLAEAQEVIPVETAIDRALQNNLQIRQAEFQHSLSEQDLKRSKLDFYPTLNSGISGSKNWGLFFNTDVGALTTESANNLSGSLSSQAVLFQGFRRIHQISANKHQLLADANNIEKTKNDLILSVVTKYLEAIVNLDLWTASQQQLALSNEQLGAMEINIEVGNNTLADLSQAKSQVATDELNVISTQNAYDLAVLELKQLMEMDPMNEIKLQRPDLPTIETLHYAYAADDVYLQAVNIYPDIKVAEEQSKVADKNIQIAQGAYYPTVSLGGNISTNYSSAIPDLELNLPRMAFSRQLERNFSQAVFFNISIPIFNNLETRINVTRARINYQNSLTNEQLAKNNLNKIIHQAVLDLRAAEKRYHSTEMAFTSAKDAFDVIKQRFDVGLANSIELSTSQTAMNSAEFEHIQAKYDLIFRSKVIDFYLGNQITF